MTRLPESPISLLFPFTGIILLTVLSVFQLNQAAFIFLNQVSEYTGQSVWALLTLFGDPAVIMCLALILVISRQQIALAILPSLLIGLIVVFSLKTFFNTPRPELVLQGFNLIGNSPDSPAFPSGHTTGAITFATLLLLHYKNPYLQTMIIVMGFLVAFSRIAVGAHWPLDIAGGLILGWLIAYAGNNISKQWRIKRTGARNIGLLLLVGAIFLAFKNTGYQQIYLLQMAISVLAAVVSLAVIFEKITTAEN